MGFLEENWDKIDPRCSEGISHDKCAAESFLRPWVHDNANMDMIVQALSILKPRIAVELGTFEAFGTYKMAEAMCEYGGGFLYTFDVGHSPANSLGEVYGAARTFEEGPIVDWKSFPKNHQCSRGWKSWEKVIAIREERFKEMKEKFSNVELIYVEGLTYDTLPKTMSSIDKWDFCFQDTLHTTQHIIEEWKLYKKKSAVGSVIVFDDITEHLNFDFIDWFKKKEKGWIYKHTSIGHGQLWAERIK